MKNYDVEQKVRSAFEHATPNVLESVLSDCSGQKGTVIVMKKVSKKVTWGKRIGALAAALLLVMGLGFAAFYYRSNYVLAATVSLDVNPSVEISVNRQDKVLEVQSNNADGSAILEGMNLEGSDLNVAVNAIIGSMVRKGYINELANSVLVSVNSEDNQTGTILQEKMAKEIAIALDGYTFSAAVISQTVEEDTQLQAEAEEYGISLGKAKLISQIIANRSDYTFDELAVLSINELKLISESPSVELGSASAVGYASDKSYIGSDKAIQIALEQLQAKQEEISNVEVEFDYELGKIVYEIEFAWNGCEYNWYIDAQDGVVLNRSTFAECDIDGQLAAHVAIDHAGLSEENVIGLRCELDLDDAVPHYDVEFRSGTNEYEYEIDGKTGQVIRAEKDVNNDLYDSSDPDAENTVVSATDTDIGSDNAIIRAFHHAGLSATAVSDLEWERERENGVVVYEVDFDTDIYEYSYKIDAATGEVMEHEKEIKD